jgi:peptide-methionine (R)-S-oxide reductase
MKRRDWLKNTLTLLGLGAAAGCARAEPEQAAMDGKFEFVLTDAQWRERLTPAAYRVLRKSDTEPAGSSPLDHEKRAGTFHCAGCDLPLYSSKTKYDSGTGWPSFWKPLDDAIATKIESSWFGPQTEVHCRRCGGHLGHVFDDGPPPTGLRYCMNGVALKFVPDAVDVKL